MTGAGGSFGAAELTLSSYCPSAGEQPRHERHRVELRQGARNLICVVHERLWHLSLSFSTKLTFLSSLASSSSPQFIVAKDGRVHGRYGPAVPPSVLVRATLFDKRAFQGTNSAARFVYSW